MPRANAAAWLVVACLLYLVHLQGSAVSGAPFGDPDSLTRLTFLEWAVPQGRILSPFFGRDGAPYGMLLHWTLPFNGFVLSLAAPGWLVSDLRTGLEFAQKASSPVSLVVYAGVTLWGFRILGFRKPHRILALALLALAPVVLAYGQPGKVNHHVITGALGSLAFYSAWAFRRYPSVRSGAGAAFSMVLAAWQSMETVPAVLAGYGVLILAVSQTPVRTSKAMWSCTAGLIGFSAAVFAIDPPWPFFVSFTGHRYSLLHVTLLACMSAGLWSAHRQALEQGRGSIGAWRKLFWGAGLAGSCVLIWAVMQLPKRGNVIENPLYDAYFWNHIGELQSGLTSIASMVGLGLLPGIALLVLGWKLWRSRQTASAPSVAILFIALLGHTACAFLFMRFGTYAPALAAPVAAAGMGGLLMKRGLNSRVLTAVLSGVCIAALLLLMPAPTIKVKPGVCEVSREDGAIINKATKPDDIIFSDIWSSPGILWHSHARTVAGPYTANIAGILDVAQVFALGPQDALHSLISGRQAKGVLTCLLQGYSTAPYFREGGLQRKLHKETPEWLTEIPLSRPQGPLKFFLMVTPDKR